MTSPERREPPENDGSVEATGPEMVDFDRQAFLAYQGRMGFRMFIAFPGKPTPEGYATEERIELVLVRGLDVNGERVFHAFGPAGYQLPPLWRPVFEPMPVDTPGVDHPGIRIEIGANEVGRAVFLGRYNLQRTNN